MVEVDQGKKTKHNKGLLLKFRKMLANLWLVSQFVCFLSRVRCGPRQIRWCLSWSSSKEPPLLFVFRNDFVFTLPDKVRGAWMLVEQSQYLGNCLCSNRSNGTFLWKNKFVQTPTLREKSILLVKMMTYIEKRFPEDLELNAQFLDLVNYVYR